MRKTNNKLAVASLRKLRKSDVRESMLAVLTDAAKPLSVVEMLALLAKKGTRVNKTTVYREIDILKKTGRVREVFFRNDTALYELAGDHHHHLVCVSCGDVREVRIDESLDQEEQRIARREHFAIIEHSLEFFGMCERCR